MGPKFVRRWLTKPRPSHDHVHLPASFYNARKLEKDGWEYELTFQYTDDEDLERQIKDLSDEMSQEADLRNGSIECSFTEVGTDRSW